MIRKLSISRSIYLLKRRVSFLLITTGYTSHVFFFTTECCDFGDRQPWSIDLSKSYNNAIQKQTSASWKYYIVINCHKFMLQKKGTALTWLRDQSIGSDSGNIQIYVKSKKTHCHLKYGYFLTVNQIVMTTVYFF
jgi:hypothetical protein